MFSKFMGIATAPWLNSVQMKNVMGTHVTTEGCDLIDRSVSVIDENGKFVARFVKNVPGLAELQRNARPGLLRARGDFSNRASFVGRGMQMNRIRQDGTLSERRGVPRSIVKTLGRTGFLGFYDYEDKETGQIVCRQTTWTINDFAAYEGLLPLMAKISEVLKATCPEQYAAQMEEVEKIAPQYRIGDLPWGTATINIDSRGVCHIDEGDLPTGTAALIAEGDFEGSGLVLPRFKLHFDIRAGDLLLFNPHEVHANPPLKGHRLSVVLYVRGRLHQCKSSQ